MESADRATPSLQDKSRALGEQIAEQLGVTQKTVSNWLSNSAPRAELLDADPALPDAATLDAIAAKIRDQAKEDVRAEVAGEIKAEIDAVRKDFAERLEALNKEIAEREKAAKDDRDAAASIHEATLAEIDAGMRARQAVDEAAKQARNDHTPEDEKLERALDAWDRNAPARRHASRRFFPSISIHSPSPADAYRHKQTVHPDGLDEILHALVIEPRQDLASWVCRQRKDVNLHCLFRFL